MLDREAQGEEVKVVPDVLAERLVNRSFMVDQWDRLYRDSVLVRFEDASSTPGLPLLLWRNFWIFPIPRA